MIRRLLPMVGVFYVLIAAQPVKASELTVTLTAEQPAVLITLAPGQLEVIAHTDVACNQLTVDAYISIVHIPTDQIVISDDDGAHNAATDCLASRLTYPVLNDEYALRVTSCCGRPYGVLRVEIISGALATTTTTTSAPPETTTTEPATTTTIAPTTTVEPTTTTMPETTTSTTYEPTSTSTSIASTTAPPTTPVSTLASLPDTVPPIITDSTSAPTTAPVETSTSTISTTSTTSPTTPKISNPSVKAAASNALAPGVTPEAQRAIVAASLTMLMAAPTAKAKK